MLAEFSRLVGTLKRRMPAIERGILFSDPTRLQNAKDHFDYNYLSIFIKPEELSLRYLLSRLFSKSILNIYQQLIKNNFAHQMQNGSTLMNFNWLG